MSDFLDEIAAAPDDPAPYLIYADALQLRGDPRGELIWVQHALETAEPATAADLRRREAGLIDAHREAWVGPLLAHRDALAIRWRYGFVHAARIASDTDEAVPALAALCAMQTLAELRIGSPWSPDLDDDDEWPAVQPLLDAPWPKALRRLHVCDGDLRGMYLAPPVRVPERAKALDTLVVASPALELEWNASPAQLRTLEIRAPRFADRGLLAIREWPNLESLTVWTEDASRILLMLARAQLPRLRHLGLCGTAHTSQLVTELAKHPILAQLESLDLRGGVLSMTKALQPLASRLKIDVRYNLIGKDERAKLRAFGATVKPQRRGTLPLTDRDTMAEEATRADAKKPAADPAWNAEARAEVRGDKRERLAGLVALAAECRESLLHPGSTDRSELYISIADICEDSASLLDAECWLWLAVEETRWYETPDAEVRALGHIGTIRMRRGDPTHAVPIMDRVLAHYLATGSDSEQAWALRQRGNVDLVRSEYPGAEGFYRRALELYRKRGDRNNEGIVLSELSGVLWSRQDFEGAVAMLRESITLRPEGSLGLGSCYYNLGAVLNGMSRIEESIEAGEKALAVFRKHERPDGIGQSLSLLGELAQRSNRHDEAEQLLGEALELHRERGANRETGITLGNLANVALDRGHYAKARALCEEAVELHREVGNKYNEGMQLIGLVDAAIGERRYDDALALVDEALVPLVAINNLPAMAAAKLRRGYVAQLRGDHDLADRHYDEANADTTRGNYPELVGWSALWRAVARAAQHRTAEAEALLGEARAILATSLQGMDTLRMTEAVLARLAGNGNQLPEPHGWDARLIATFAS